MALVGNMIADAIGGNPSIVNYVMFVSVFGMLSLFYLIMGTINETFAISPFFMLAADALNTIFFFVGGVALAAYLDVHSCHNHVSMRRKWQRRMAKRGLTVKFRVTSQPIKLLEDQTMTRKDVKKHKRLLPSSGSASSRSLEAWCSPACQQGVVARRRVCAVFEEVGPPCPRSRCMVGSMRSRPMLPPPNRTKRLIEANRSWQSLSELRPCVPRPPKLNYNISHAQCSLNPG